MVFVDEQESEKLEEISKGIITLTSEFNEFKRSAKLAHETAYQNKERLDQAEGRQKAQAQMFDRLVRAGGLIISSLVLAVTGLGIYIGAS